ncbi:MAG TPA: hypothetical protein VEV17_21780 [Bryobacteraceae bacterium]|nr:hypothetical protein [Bryobacteraceae bacterium]
MRIPSFGTKVAVIGVLCVAGGAGAVSITPRNLEGHRSSLKAKLTLSDGTVRAVTLEGVGCPMGMCSRVKARESKNESLWLDALASIRGISPNAGAVTATFKFRDGTERRAAIMAANRVLFLQGHFGLTEKLDLGSVSKIDFE